MIKKFIVALLFFSFALQVFPERVLAAPATVAAPGTFTQGTSATGTGGSQDYFDNSVDVTKDGTKHKVVARWIRGVNGEFVKYGSVVQPAVGTGESGQSTQNSTPSQSGVWLHKISQITYDGQTLTIDPAILTSIYLMSEIKVDQTYGPTQNPNRTVRKITDVVKIVCQGTSSVWTTIFGRDCPQINGPAGTYDYELSPRGSTSFNVYAKSSDGTELPVNSTIDPILRSYLIAIHNSVKSTPVTIATAKLPQSAINACQSIVLKKPESEMGFPAFTAMQKTANVFADALDKSGLKDSNGAAVKKSSDFDPGMKTNAAVIAADKELYRIFYRSGDNIYTDDHTLQGNVNDQLMSTMVAYINQWQENNVWDWDKALKVMLIGGGSVTADSAANAALTWADTVKVSAKVSKEIATASKAAGEVAAEAFESFQAAEINAFAAELEANAAGGAAGLGSTAVASILLGGAIVIGGTLAAVSLYKAQQNQAFYESLFESWLMSHYITAHLAYHQCIQDKGGLTAAQAEATGFTSDILKQEKASLALVNRENGGLQTPLNTQDTKDLYGCPKLGGLLSGFDIIGWAMCQASATIYNVSSYLFKAAVSLAEKSIGVEQ